MGRDRLRLIVRAALIAALVMGCISDKVREASPSPRPTATSSVMPMPTASPGGKATIGPHPTQTPNAIVITADLPAGGISETRAIEMAREHVRLDARLWATMAGRLIEVNGSLGIQFDLPVEICPPPPHDCLEPRPGLSTVILDYYTGSHYHSSVYSPGSGWS